MIRSLVGAFWPGCFLDFLEADDLPEFFRETFAELAEFLPAGLLALFPVAVDFVAVGFVADTGERPAALFAEVEVELDFFGATAWLGALLPAVLFTLLFVEAAAVLLVELVLLPETAFT